MAILRPRKIKPEFIAIYLKTKFGQSQIQRFTRGAVQMGLILEDMDQLLVPDFSDEFEKVIVQVVQAVKFCLKKSEYTYYQAEDLLLSELGLKDWQPTEENIAVKSFSASFGTSRRLDAEHYQPKFDQLIEKLQEKVKLTRLGKLLTKNQRGKQPKYLDEGVESLDALPVINSKHVRTGEVLSC